MANVTATGSISNVNVTSTISNITVSDTLSNIAVSNISSQTVNVAVTSTNTVVNVAALATIANSTIRPAISANTTPGGLASLTYNNLTGVMLLTGPTSTDVRSVLSNTSPITYNNSTGVIGIDSGALFTGKTTDDLTEGSTNLYFNGRNTDQLSEGSTNLYFTNTRANSAIGAYQGAISTPGNISTTGTLSAGTLSVSQRLLADLQGNIYEGSSIILARNKHHLVNAFRAVEVENGTHIGIPYFGRASAANAVTMPAIGVTLETTTAGDNCNILVGGKVTFASSGTTHFSTGMPIPGDRVFVSGETGTAGKFSNTRPTGSNIVQQLGTVLTVDTSNNITMFVEGAISQENISSSDDVPEGGTNLYFTTNRANSAIAGYQGNINTPGIATFGNNASDTHQFTGNINVIGNIEVNGNLDYRNVEDLFVRDQQIVLNANATSDASSSIKVFRPVAGANAIISWNEAADIWEFTDGSATYPLPTSTTDLAEGTNLYFSNARAIAQANIAIGTNTTDNLSEGSTNLYYSNARVLNYVTRSGGISGNILLAGNFTTTAGSGSTGIITAPLLQIGSAGANPGSGISHPLVVDATNVGVRYNFTANTFTDLNVLGDSLVLNTRAGAGTKADANAFIVVDREVAGANAQIKWNESTDKWQINNGSGYLDIVSASSGTISEDLSGVVLVNVRNETGSTLNKGKAVYLTGSNTGDVPHVALADANDSAKMPALGLIKENISNASNGFAVVSGEFNVASHGFTAGADLFISTTPGTLTVTKPTGESSQIQKIGKSVGPNHILVQGAFRSNQTPNLNQGNIFLGDSNNQTRTTTPSTNFKTTGNVFELSNALTNINSITSESANDVFSVKALLGGGATPTFTGNVKSDGYEVILDSSRTYDVSGNITQTGSNNLNGFAVSGSFTSGSAVFSITGVTELKNVFNSTGNIDGTNNNVSLTGDMVANMIPDNFDGVGGDQYPLPAGTVLNSANTTALVFSQNALASQTFSNTAPIAILHGGRDTTTGQIISFTSQDDAVADGTQVVNLDIGANGSVIALSFTGESPGTGETSDSITIGLPTTPDIPVGTAVTFAGVTGTGASNLNGQTLFIKRDVFGDNFNYTLTTDAGGTTAATMTAFGLASFNTGSGNITYNVPQSTSTINKSFFYKQDTYGYPIGGPSSSDFTFSVGSASDYTIDITGAGGYGGAGNNKSIRGRNSLEIAKGVFKAPEGLVIGDNTTMSNRGDNDTFTNFGLNFVWDGLTNYTNEYAGSSGTTLIPQMLFKSYTDNTFGSGSSGKGRGGPRLFFAPSTGNINTIDTDKYPRKSQELGRLTFWGPTQGFGDVMSTVNPPGFISAVASEDWTTSNRSDMFFGSNAKNYNDADVFLAFSKGKVVIGSADAGSGRESIHFAPAIEASSGNAAQSYATIGHTWANVNYANVSANTGAKLTVTQGGAVASGSGDTMFSLDRDLIQGSTTLNLQAVGNGAVLDQDIILGNGNQNTVVVVTSASADIADGNPVTFAGVGGPGAGNLNGQSFFIKAGSIFDSGGANPDSFQLFHDSGLSNAVVRSQIGYDTNPATFTTGGGNCTITTTGTTARDYTFNLASGSENLALTTNGVTHTTFYSNGNLQIAGDLVLGDYKMPTADGSNGQFIKTDGNGTLTFGTVSGSGTVTSVGSGNGLTGGPITGSGNLAVGAGNGITVNATNVAINTGVVADLSSTQVFTGAKTLDVVTLKQFNETVVNLGSQSGNIAAVAGFNAANASIFTLTATGGITISEIPNKQTGGSYTIKIIQDGTGSHALTSTFKFAGGDKTLSTAASSIDVINVVYDGTDYLATLSKAYA